MLMRPSLDSSTGRWEQISAFWRGNLPIQVSSITWVPGRITSSPARGSHWRFSRSVTVLPDWWNIGRKATHGKRLRDRRSRRASHLYGVAYGITQNGADTEK